MFDGNSESPAPRTMDNTVGNLKPESVPEQVKPENVAELGTRRQNRLPDKGEPNSIKKNEPGTTIKRYNSEGNTEKEFNRGHQGDKTPEVEKSDHVHDYEPNPHNPTGRGFRQPGRPLNPGEEKDFGL